jgi:S1-C subfamily serine protease
MASLRRGLFVTGVLVLDFLFGHIAPVRAQLEELVAKVKGAVVVIRVDTVRGSGHGSGFIYDKSGLVLTNQHVVEGATNISVTLLDGRSFPATVVQYYRYEPTPDASSKWYADAAVLKITASNLPALPLQPVGQSVSVRQGQDIIVLGYPGGVGTKQVSVTPGIVSAVRPGWIQTNADIVPGNSGGPVVDKWGRVIGIATFVTGPGEQFLRIGGITSIVSVRPIAESARRGGYWETPESERVSALSVDGLEYLDPPTRVFGENPGFEIVGGQPVPTSASPNFWREKQWKVQYLPEDTVDQGETWIETETMGWPARNLAGAAKYCTTITEKGLGYNGYAHCESEELGYRDNLDRYYLDSTGLYYLGGPLRMGGIFREMRSWRRRVPPRPLPLVLLPLRAGQPWDFRDTWIAEGRARAYRKGEPPPEPYPSRVELEGQAQVDSLSESITVPAGTFEKSRKITHTARLTWMAGQKMTKQTRYVETTWYSIQLGRVRSVTQVVGVGSWVRELSQTNWKW